MTSVGRHNAMLTPRDVASLLSIDINTVRRWTNQGLLKAYRIGPRGDRRFRKEDIDLFLSEKRQIDTNNEDSVG
jgi:excisionase family DNA binding protein